nr:hypothetical protein [Anaerolineae bacterium]
MAEQRSEAQSSEFFQHIKAAGKASVRQWASLVPKDFWVYGGEVVRETFLAAKAVVDGVIDALDRAPSEVQKTTPAPRKGKKKIEIIDAEEDDLSS